MKFRKRDLEIILQKLPPNLKPNIDLEQYPTPANIATDILFSAFLAEDITEKSILDLGCGTGVFSIGAKLLGADNVTGIDLDSNSLAIARSYANSLSLDIDFIEKDISDLSYDDLQKKAIDTVLQNPPFGAQKGARGIDRMFLEKAILWGKVVYTLHLTKTSDFVELLINKLGGEITLKKEYRFPIRHTYFFHTKERVDFDITMFRIITNTKT